MGACHSERLDRAASPSEESTSRSSGLRPQDDTSKVKKNIFLLILIVFLLAVFPLAGSLAVCKHLEHRLDIKIQGQFAPGLFTPAFYLKNARFEWNGKVRFENGDLKVEYNPFSFLMPEGLRVRLTGKNLQVRLLGDWAKMQGVEKADLEKFEADFSLGRKGLNEIYCVEVESKAFQFHLRKSENKSITASQEKKS